MNFCETPRTVVRQTHMNRLLLTTTLLASLATTAFAGITIPRNTVLEATADQDLSIKDRREGDRFSVTVASDRDLPRGTRIWGVINRIEPARDGRPAYMDLQFERIEYPGSNDGRLSAVPIPLDAKGVERGRDGRLVANPKKVKTGDYVVGGLLGGLVVGALVKKPFEGAFLGTLAGIVLGETERQNAKKQQDLVMRKGNRLGVLLMDDLAVDSRWDRNREDRWDRDRDDRDRDDRDRNGNDEIRFDGQTLRLDSFRDRNELMVPLTEAARALNLEVDRRDDRIWIDGRRTSARVRLNDSEARLDGRRGDLGAQIQERNSEVYVPLGLLAALVEGEITLNGTKVRAVAF
jgi:hypothetical protein